ncbi:MAG: hypothetical protein GY749_38080 [Desulfobacteraceae bacterium]|nr:hypothetical protein [Desulfobacteraceae bacterium]
MNTIILKSEGSIFLNRELLDGGIPLKMLGYQVEIENGYSLRSLFEMIGKYPVLSELNDFFPSYMEEYSACPETGCCIGGIDYIELYKTVEMIAVPEKRLETYCSLVGVRNGETSEIKSLHFENLLDLPLILGRLKHTIFGDQVDVFEFDTVYNLFEFLDGIAWELGFHRTPKQCGIRR